MNSVPVALLRDADDVVTSGVRSANDGPLNGLKVRDVGLRSLSGEVFLDGGYSLVGEPKGDLSTRPNAAAKPVNCDFDRILRRGLGLIS